MSRCEKPWVGNRLTGGHGVWKDNRGRHQTRWLHVWHRDGMKVSVPTFKASVIS